MGPGPAQCASGAPARPRPRATRAKNFAHGTITQERSAKLVVRGQGIRQEDAVRCIEEGRWRGHFRARRLAAEAEAWVRCERREWPFSFVNICEVLGFDVDAMRAHLLTSPRDAEHRRHTRRKKHPSAPACIRLRGSDVAAMTMQQLPRASGERSRRCTASSPRMDPRRVRGDEPTRAANLKEDVPCIFDVPRRSPACPTSP
jgi:hypothetical protein